MAALTICSARVEAQLPESIVVDDVECEYRTTVVFETNSAVVNLAAQAELNRALQWMFDAPGRYLYILGADGPRPADARLGTVRTGAVVNFLMWNGAAGPNIMRGDFSVLRTSRLQAGLRSFDVIVMACETAALSP
jgi:hypothetical protein